MSDVVRIKLYVGTGFANCQHEDIFEIESEVWENMTEDERDKLLDELAVDFRNDVIDCSAWVIEEDE